MSQRVFFLIVILSSFVPARPTSLAGAVRAFGKGKRGRQLGERRIRSAIGLTVDSSCQYDGDTARCSAGWYLADEAGWRRRRVCNRSGWNRSWSMSTPIRDSSAEPRAAERVTITHILRRIALWEQRSTGMPLYEYRCLKCDKRFELLIRGDQEPECPHCGGKKLDRLISAPAVHASSGGSSLPVNESPCSTGVCQSGKCPFQ